MKKLEEQIEIIVRALLVHKNKVLICHNPKKPPSFFYLLGGHVEKGETLRNALNRELSEEIGVKSNKAKLLDVSENFYKDWQGEHHEINFLYEINITNSPDTITSKEKHLKLKWINISDLKNINLLPVKIKKLIINYLDKK